MGVHLGAYSVRLLVNTVNPAYTVAMRTPAQVVIDELGVRPLARKLNISPSTILRWRERGKGFIPSTYHREIIRVSEGRITAEDLVYGDDPLASVR